MDTFSWLDIAVKMIIATWVVVIVGVAVMYFTLGKYKNW